MKNKKGVNEIIAYVLLILIVVGIAAGIYSYLRSYIPINKEKCPEDVSVIITNSSCSFGSLNLTLYNSGLFSIHGAFAKIGEAGRVSKETLNCPLGLGSENCSIYFWAALEPQKDISLNFSYSDIGDKEVEIEPVVLRDSETLVCVRAIATQNVRCS